MYVCPAAWKSPLVIPAIAHCKSAWEFGGIAASAASPLAASPHARLSREISVAGGGSPKPAGSLPSSRVAAPPGAPFAGDHATGSPLTQCPPARLWLNVWCFWCQLSLFWCDFKFRPWAKNSSPNTNNLYIHYMDKITGTPPFFRREKRHFQTVSKPAGLPLTQTRRIAADSSPLDRRWFMPAGRRYP